MRILVQLLLFLFCGYAMAQSAMVSGYLQDEKQLPIPFANVILYSMVDSSLVKAGITTEIGLYQLNGIPKGFYFLQFSSLGYGNLKTSSIELKADQKLDLGTNTLKPSLETLDEVTLTATRPVISVKPDRMIFNVENTVNSVGFDVISLLRKAPVATIDNNNNISVLGRTGVLVYIDGKRLPLTGDNLSNYLQNISSEQIDRLEIITNPDVSYDAEGNAGIIDIRLKKDKNLGINGTLKTTYGQGQYANYNVNASGNCRNKKLNVFTTVGISENNSFNESSFDNYQNVLRLLETNNFKSNSQDFNFRLGMDFFLAQNHTLGILINGNQGANDRNTPSKTQISNQNTPNQIDSLLVVNGTSNAKNARQTYNLNYLFENKNGKRLNIDLDYGKYRNESERFQPNEYFDSENELLLEEISQIDAPTEIDIFTFKVDFEYKFWEGTLGIGSKTSKIITENKYLFFDGIDDFFQRNNNRSRLFNYAENVFANYLNYSKSFSEKWNLSLGLRVEKTNAKGNLQAFVTELDEPPVKLDYLNWFPSVGLTWQASTNNNYSFNYGRRINRPNYFLLNPFTDQITQLSFEKGNPFLRPEIVNNFEIGYSHTSNYNFKIFYSRTKDKITRLVGPDENDPRATFSTFENLGSQTVFGFNSNISLKVSSWLKTYFNFSSSYIDNQANFGDDAIIDLQVFSYKIYSQNSFKLGNGFNAEISGYYNGPNIFGGNFKMKPIWSIDVGLQRKFLNENLNVRLVATDIFYTNNFEGVAEFDGLTYFGNGRRDSRRVSINLSYNFGNQNLKSRNRNQGLENEQKRIE
ncbi:outer membrane beta-barrel family protein [Aquimarina sp. RZ0]|uniref:outer membrane beta-barrel family protein n=1 Tax=Aquimarina sp. RZ0 TaxID=2607730 RepID=UPI0011F29AE5|nr:outer membrane beta-barrel family protein [Aquimarina sp. RZ0]KAA1248016.1 TonB-dependent receptor [Aquimarina sp. RZ0]